MKSFNSQKKKIKKTVGVEYFLQREVRERERERHSNCKEIGFVLQSVGEAKQQKLLKEEEEEEEEVAVKYKIRAIAVKVCHWHITSFIPHREPSFRFKHTHTHQHTTLNVRWFISLFRISFFCVVHIHINVVVNTI